MLSANRKIVATFVFFIALFSSRLVLAQQNIPASEIQALDEAVSSAMEQHKVPGAAVAIVNYGSVVLEKAYGLADSEKNLPMRVDTVFESASVSKPVSVWGVMRLVEQGKIDLDAPVSRYLTRWKLPASEFDNEQVTLRRILSHTAGIGSEGDPGLEPGVPVPSLEETLSGAVKGMGDVRVLYKPGEAYSYSSKAYLLAELVVEEVTGQRFNEYMYEQILKPLGMNSSYYGWLPELRSRVATPYNWYGEPLPYYNFASSAQGRLRTTAGDLAIFIAAHFPGPNGEPIGRGVISAAAVKEILSPVAVSGPQKNENGIGYDLSHYNNELIARKTGDNRGWKPIIFLLPERQMGIAVMSNSDRAIIGFLMDVTCGWGETQKGNPLQGMCSTVRTFRDVQYGLSALLGLGLVIYLARAIRQIRSGKRQFGMEVIKARPVRVALLAGFLGFWWWFFYTDSVFSLLGWGDHFVTVRLIVPWATAFIWVSYAVSAWLLALIIFSPGNNQKSVSVSGQTQAQP